MPRYDLTATYWVGSTDRDLVTVSAAGLDWRCDPTEARLVLDIYEQGDRVSRANDWRPGMPHSAFWAAGGAVYPK